METVDQLARKAIELKPIDRLKLAEALLSSLDKVDPEIEGAWIAESEARYDAYKNGEIQALEWTEIKKRLQK